MGIYTDLSIFGIRIYNVSYDDDIYNLFQRKYDLVMTDEKIKEAYLFYEELYDCYFDFCYTNSVNGR